MSNPSALLSALRDGFEVLSSTVSNLNAPALASRSYCKEWSIADVLSHLGSQAEIFELCLDAGLSAADAPSQEQFAAIWGKWNARNPEEQAVESLAANDLFLQRLESISATELEGFQLIAFGGVLDASEMLRMRLFEFAVHTWDITVALDGSSVISEEATDLLIDHLGRVTTRAGRPIANPAVVKVITNNPPRQFALALNGVTIEAWNNKETVGELTLPSESLIRLVYGRLDDQHATGVVLTAGKITLDDLRSVFPGM